jgi:hypothetical protein
LLDAFIFVGLNEPLLMPRALEFDCFAINAAEYHLEELPHAIDVATMHAAHMHLNPVVAILAGGTMRCTCCIVCGGRHWHRFPADDEHHNARPTA